MSRYQLVETGGVYDHIDKLHIDKYKNPAAWSQYLAWVTAGNQVLPPAAQYSMDVDKAIESKQAEVMTYAAGKRNAVILGLSVGELAAWAIKLIEALDEESPLASLIGSMSIEAGLPQMSSFLELEAHFRGESAAQMQARVLQNAARFLFAEAAISGTEGRHKDALAACETLHEVMAYDYTTGWPEL